MAKRSDEELDAIAGVGRSQLLAAFANGEVKVVEVRADARRVRIKSPQVYDLPQPILPTACNHEFDAILGSNKCKHCGCSFVQAWHGGGRAKSV